VAGLRPGFGLGGMTHSLLVMEVFGAMMVAIAAAATACGPLRGLLARGSCDGGPVDVVEPGEAADAGEEAAEAGDMASCKGRGLGPAAEMGRAVAMVLMARTTSGSVLCPSAREQWRRQSKKQLQSAIRRLRRPECNPLWSSREAPVAGADTLCAPKNPAACSGRQEIDEYGTRKPSTMTIGEDDLTPS